MNGGIQALAVVLAVGIQINATLPIAESGLRVSLADLMLPIAVIMLLFAWRQSGWHRLHGTSATLPLWIAGMTGVLILSFLIGYARADAILPWALYNKLLGWFVLVAYLLVGACLVRFEGAGAIQRFVTVFCIAAAGTAAFSSIGFPFLGQLNTLPILIQDARLTGFIQNSNAFGFLIVVALCLSLGKKTTNHWIIVALFTALFFTNSRGAWIAGLGAVITLLAVDKTHLRSLKKAVPWSIAAIVAIAGAHFLVADLTASGAKIMAPDRFHLDGATVVQRVDLGKLALRLFAESPIFGTGLGVFQHEAVAAGHPVGRSTIHSSPLWLLTETGIVGVAVFAGFFITFLLKFFWDRQSPLPQSMLAIMVAFAIISLTGEFIYQRYLWILFGMAIAVRGTKDAVGNKETA